MKKLNRKGFTLIELLAVVVVLAILLITLIPIMLNATSDAKHGQFENAASELSKWLTDQYSLTVVGVSTADSAYTGWLGTDNLSNKKDLNAAVIKAGGITDTTGLTGYAILKTNNKVCVQLTASSSSKFYAADKDNTVYSYGCSATDFPTDVVPEDEESD